MFTSFAFPLRSRFVLGAFFGTTLAFLTPLPDAAAQGIPGYAVAPLNTIKHHNQATVRVSIDGQPTSLMLDTGASTSLLDSAFYKGARSASRNVPKEDLPPDLPRQTTGNGIKADVGYVQMQVGGTNLGKGPVALMDLSEMFGQYNNMNKSGALSGLFGEDVLRHYAAVIDWRRRGVYFNVDPAKRMKNLGRELTKSGWTAIPMASTNGKRFTVLCTVNGKSAKLLVDTGAGFTTFAPGVVPLTMIYNRETGTSMGHLASMSSTSSMIGGDATVYPAEVKNWKIGNYGIERSVVAVHKFPANSLADESAGSEPTLGLLGPEILSANNAIIDIAGSTLYLKSGTKR